MNFLMCSVGRRGELIKYFKNAMGKEDKIIAVDNSQFAPALYLADKQYIVPRITEDNYIETLLDICQKEDIKAIATFIDPEIEVLSKNREQFENKGSLVLVPYHETAKLCFDKYKLYQHMSRCGLPTVQTYGTLKEFEDALNDGKITFPVFVKPRTGSGSVGARKISDLNELSIAIKADPSLIIQELMQGIDLDVDIYVDTQSKEVVSAFSKKKISTTIGGANKTISFKDETLFELIRQINSSLELYGPNDMDFFYRDGQYYLSEINPRFGGAYLHAYGAGVDFVKLIQNNVNGQTNAPEFGNYDEGIVMMMYDSVVIRRECELAETIE